MMRDFWKMYHQQAATSKDSDQNSDFIFAEINSYHQIGDTHLQNHLSYE